MNDNWWMMQQQIAARQREIRLRVKLLRPWVLETRQSVRPPAVLRIRRALGSLLVTWGRAIAAEPGHPSQTPAATAEGSLAV